MLLQKSRDHNVRVLYRLTRPVGVFEKIFPTITALIERLKRVLVNYAVKMTLESPHLSAEDWPIVVAERDQLRLETEHLHRVVMNLSEEIRKLQSSVKSTKKKLSFTDQTFGVANLCK
jgi:hypothetical protein